MRKPHIESLCTPGECLDGLWKRVPGYIRRSFLAAVVSGFAVHLYVFANKFTNHDDLGESFLADYGAASGRWFLPPAAGLDGDFSMPWLIGVLSILCLACAVCLTVSLLRVRSTPGCVLTAALMVSFPAVTSTFGYMYSADTYFFSLLLAAFGAWAAVNRGWWGSLLCAVCVTLSLGIYQCYFQVAAVLMVGALLFEVLDGEKSFRELFLKGLRLVGTLAVGLIAYLVVVKLTTRDIQLTSYQGIDQMGKIALGDLPGLIWKSYVEYFRIFVRNDFGIQFRYLGVLYLLVGVSSVVLGVLLLRRLRLGAARTAMAAGLAVIYPLAGNLIFVMAPGGLILMHMLYGMVYMLLFPIALAEYVGSVLREDKARLFHGAVSWAVLVSMALTVYSYAVTDNNIYFKADLGMRQCTAYSNRLLERVESCEGYRPELPVVLVGSQVSNPRLTPTPELNGIAYVTGYFGLADFLTYFTYADFLRIYTGFSGTVLTGTSAQAQAFAALEEVQAMPLYPSDGSVRVIQDAVVVRMG